MLDTMKDTSIKIKPSKKLECFILEQFKDCDNIPDGIKQFIIYKSEGSTDGLLKVCDINWLNQNLKQKRETGNGTAYLHELLEGSDIKLPEPEIIPRNPELEARIQRLKAEQANREYRAMTKKVDAVRTKHPEDSISYQIKQINKQLIAVFQFIMSVAAGFTFGFLGVELLVGNLDFGFRLLLGVICALIIALAEIYFLAKKLSEDMSMSYSETLPYKKQPQPDTVPPKKQHQD